MNRFGLTVFLLSVCTFSFAQAPKTPTKPKATPAKSATPATPAKKAPTQAGSLKMANELDSVAYSIGMNIGQNIKGQGLNDLNLDLLMQGLKDMVKTGKGQIDEGQANMVLGNYFNRIQTAKQAEEAKKYEVYKAAGEKFLAENKTKEGVVTLPSGLQYQIIKAGDGPKPTINDKVKTHYHGTLTDGTVFDSSVQRGQPIDFPVGGVIAGWTEALQLMPVGSKWKLFIPYNLAYGERGAGANIKPYSALIFEVELLEIMK
ncbi:MAG: FKBP-type peptidyl-prolyl cis-trans isomerase [Spirosomaceae bacterium]|nr:FKBP-type peptidyl-prolyl cis-trans isomerase [Spirosomataceae bacterium]